ncbi:Abortive infection protein, partial [Clostridium carboxidivorans P7]
MLNINPFKRISYIENGIAEFKKMDIINAIGVMIFYVIATIFMSVLFMKDKAGFSLKIFIFNGVKILLIFTVLINLFYYWYSIIIDEKNICKKTPKKITIKNVFYITIALLGFRIISSYLTIFILAPFSKVLMPKFMLKAVSETIEISFFIYVCIIGPAMEEFVFRGVILTGLLKKYSVKKSIIISALLFGIMHLNGIQFINGFLLGVLLGYIYVRTKSIYLCMYSHILFNTMGVIFMYIPKINNLLVTVLFAIVAFIFMIYGIKKIDNFRNGG